MSPQVKKEKKDLEEIRLLPSPAGTP